MFNPSVRCEHRKAIYSFQVNLCSPCGTIILTTKPICYIRMRRLVSVRVFFLTLIASVGETKTFPAELVALIFLQIVNL